MNVSRILKLILVTSLLIVTACGVPLRQPEAPRGGHFSVLTYNINFGGPSPHEAVQVILDADADVVLLQETTPAWEKTLRDALEATYPQMRFRNARGAGGMAVLSRLPFKELHYAQSDAGWFPFWVLRVDSPAGLEV